MGSSSLAYYALFFSLICFAVISCGDSFDAMKIQSYELSGIEVHYRVAYASPPDTFSIDTIQVQYKVDVEVVEEKQDTIRFYNLPGADKAYHSHGDTFLCRGEHRVYCDLDAKLIDGNKFEMYLVSPSGAYRADGYFSNGYLELEGNFFYRSTSIDYFLTGKKVNR